MSRTRCYISGPISADTPEQTEKNMLALERAGVGLRQAGYAPFVPATDTRVLGEDLRGGMTHDEWLDADIPWIEVADCVFRLPGESKGADIECALAQEIGIPVYGSFADVVKTEPTQRHGDERFQRELMKLIRLHQKKSQDYGSDEDPYANVRASEDFGVPAWIGALVRGNDKVTRLCSFARKGSLANESAEDSMMDLAVYAVMALILYREASA